MSFQSLENTTAQTSNHWKLRSPVLQHWSFVFLLLLAPVCRAQTNSADKYVLGPTNVLGEELYAFVQAADIAGTITDDAVIFAATDAKISGTISNDLWMAAANTIEISGRVGDHARVAARSVEISGTFRRGLAAAGQTVALATNSVVGEDACLAGVSVTMEGRVGSNALIRAVNATIGGHIHGAVHVNAQDIAVLPNTKIDGDFVYTSPKELFLDKSVVLGGRLTRQTAAVVSPGEIIAAQLAGTFMMAVAAFLTGVVFLSLLPRFVGNSVRLLRHSPWRCAVTGALASVLVVVSASLSAPTIVGLPLSFSLLGGMLLFVYLGNIIVALAIGSTVLRQHGPQAFLGVLMTFVLGLVVLYMLKSLPYLGAVIGLFGWFAGAGALILNMLAGQRMMPAQEPPPIPGGGDGKK